MVPNLTWLSRAPVSTGDRKRRFAYFDGMSDEEMASAIEDSKRMRAERASLQHAAAPSPQRAEASSQELGFQPELPAPDPRQELVELGFSPDLTMDTVVFPRSMRLRAYKHYFPIYQHNGSTLESKQLYVQVKDGDHTGVASRVVVIGIQRCVAFEVPPVGGSNPHRYTIYLPLDLLTNKTLIVAPRS